MKKCCIKWKQPKYIDLDVGNLHYSILQSNINFCPNCGSPLKKEIEKLDWDTGDAHLNSLRDKINELMDIIQEMRK